MAEALAKSSALPRMSKSAEVIAHALDGVVTHPEVSQESLPTAATVVHVPQEAVAHLPVPQVTMDEKHHAILAGDLQPNADSYRATLEVALEQKLLDTIKVDLLTQVGATVAAAIKPANRRPRRQAVQSREASC
jgi:hypothetical protein